ncbi:MAG: hypothetical protein E6I53_09305 [Chloroflexi bacterium]|nr:MAG: hypothetical protein E6I71_04465 [Chloroflexota bacterium]TME51667.1 MAG: hypothetical protein E6I53_09305 [Chloroflexota bacterium]
MRRRLELRDLRSLERRSMYSIFHPLDPDERLPRELILEGKRHRMIGMRFMELLGFIYLPALILGVVVMASFGIKPLVAFGLVGLLFVGIFVYVIAGRYR